MLLTYILIAIYVIVLIYIGIKDHKTEDKDGFIIADRKVGIIGTLSSLSAGLRTGGGLMVLIGGGFALKHGFYNIGFGSFLAAILLGVIAPNARKIANSKKYITINQIVRDVIGIKTEKSSAFIVMIFTVLGVSAQFYVLGKITSMLLGIDPFNSIIIAAIVVASYLCLGGYKSIIKTDILQFGIILSLWAILFFIPINKDVIFNVSLVYTSQSPLEFWSGMIYGGLLMFAYSDFWQRIFSSKNDKTAKIACGLVGPSWLLMSLPATFVGMSAIGIIPENTGLNDVFMSILESGAYPAIFISMMTLIGISITMSTLDTYSYVFSSTLLENFFKINIKNNKKKYIYTSRVVMIVMLAVSACLALSIQSILDYLFNSLSLMLVLSPLFLVTGAGWIKKTNKELDTLFMCSLIIAFIIGSYMFIQGYLTSFSMRIVPPAIASALMLLSYILRLKNK